MELLNKGCDWLLTGAVIVLAVLIIVSLIRSVRGPRIADRIIAVNMIGTMVILILAILSVYAMISFLGVVVLCKVYTGVYLQKKQMQADLNAVEDNLRRQEKRDDMAGSAARAETLKKEERL